MRLKPEFWGHVAAALEDVAAAVRTFGEPSEAVTRQPRASGGLSDGICPPETVETYYTMRQTSELTGISRANLKTMLDGGQLRYSRGPGQIRPQFRIPESEVERLLESIQKANGSRGVIAGRSNVYN